MRVEEIIGEYVQLKRAGSNFKGLSPFQDEKTPSFVVSPSKQIWKDFSTGKGGNAISFIMEIEGFTYPEALKFIAKKYSIEVKEDKRELSEEEKEALSERDLLYKIHEVANDYFIRQLHDSEEGKLIGLSYFKERALNQEIIDKFQLGYSPSKRNAFTEYALDKGYQKEILAKSGLSIFTENSPNGIDRFRERVLFPIHSFSGRVLGFGARILKNNVKTAKYLNSPETAIYHKSNVLYGIYQSKQAISKENTCFLVEGYMDVIALHQHGIENVVASSGTALTKEQIKLIKRLTENVTILFDGDKAGIKASFRSIDLLLEQGMNIRVLLFPDGDDPDSFVRKHSQEDVQLFIKENAQDFIDFKADILLKEADNDPIKKAEAIRDIVKSVAFVQNALKQEVYLKEVANKFQITEQTLFNELNVQKQIKQKQTSKPTKLTPPTSTKLEVVKNTETEISPLLELENKLVELMIKYGNHVLNRRDEDGNTYEITVIEEVLNYFEEDDYLVLSPINNKIISIYHEGINNQKIYLPDYFMTLMDEEITRTVTDALLNPHDLSNWEKYNIFFSTEEELVSKVLSDVILRHKREWIMQIIKDVKKDITDGVGDAMESYEKIKKLNELRVKMDKEMFRII